VFTLENCLVLSAILFSIGVFGVIARRNLLIVLMSIEVMLNAVNLAFLGFARAHGQNLISWVDTAADLRPTHGDAGHVFVLMIMAVAAAEAAVGLAILLAFFRNKQTVDADEVNLMKN
jgi:NADH-quinone oxidoreductase subunit K